MNQIERKIIITGTHLTPALELIRQLQSDQKNNWKIYYIGRLSNSNDYQQTSIESKIIPSLGIKFYPLPCGKFDRRFLPNSILGIPKTIVGLYKSFILINRLKPDIIVSFGGYVSVPVIISGWLQKITSITHEQTLTNSLTTKINSHFVKKIALSFNNQNQIDQLPEKKVVVTGNLLRYQLFKKTSLSNPKIKFPNPQLPTIYITAGNQGSHNINMVINELLPKLSNFNLIHQTGKNDYPLFKSLNKKYSNYLATDYFATQDYSWIIQHTNIFVSRAGANTCQEIVAFNKNAILIPLPKSQQDEQQLNALWVEKQQPQQTIVIPQEKLTPNSLMQSIESLNKQKNTPSPKSYIPNLKLLQLIDEII